MNCFIGHIPDYLRFQVMYIPKSLSKIIPSCLENKINTIFMRKPQMFKKKKVWKQTQGGQFMELAKKVIFAPKKFRDGMEIVRISCLLHDRNGSMQKI